MLLGPTNTVSGRRSTVPDEIGPKLDKETFTLGNSRLSDASVTLEEYLVIVLVPKPVVNCKSWHGYVLEGKGRSRPRRRIREKDGRKRWLVHLTEERHTNCRQRAEGGARMDSAQRGSGGAGLTIWSRMRFGAAVWRVADLACREWRMHIARSLWIQASRTAGHCCLPWSKRSFSTLRRGVRVAVPRGSRPDMRPVFCVVINGDRVSRTESANDRRPGGGRRHALGAEGRGAF